MVAVRAPQRGSAWTADVSTLDHPDRNALVTVDKTGRTITIDLDLDGQDKLFGNGVFTPSVHILMFETHTMNAYFDSQNCDW